ETLKRPSKRRMESSHSHVWRGLAPVFSGRLARVVQPARLALASTPSSLGSHELRGCDSTTGIVSVDAAASGRARVWRRVGERVEVDERRFPNWFLATSLDLLDHLPAERLGAATIRGAHGQLSFAGSLGVVELDWTGAGEADAYRYLVLTTNLDEVETAL